MLITRKAAWQILHLCMNIHLQSVERSVLVDLTLSYLDSENNTKKTVFAPPAPEVPQDYRDRKNCLADPSPGLYTTDSCLCPFPQTQCPVAGVRLLWLPEASVTVVKCPIHIHLTASSPQQGLCVELNTKENSKRNKILLIKCLDFYILKMTSAHTSFS